MANSKCSVDGCSRRAHGRGLCTTHLRRLRRTGDIQAARAVQARDVPLVERLWPKVDFRGPLPVHRPELGSCWLWTSVRSRGGYAQIGAGGKDGRMLYVHRLVFEWAYGAIPVGKELDHLCRVRHCVRPMHLEAVTHRENTLRSPTAPSAVHARQTHCKRGHPFDDGNTRIDSRGKRECITCRRLASAALTERRREQRKMP